MSGKKKHEEYVEDTFRLVSKSASHLTTQAVPYTAAHDLVFKLALDSVAALAADLHQRVTALEEKAVAQYRGVWNSGSEYVTGSLVTHAGSLWSGICPGTPRRTASQVLGSSLKGVGYDAALAWTALSVACWGVSDR